MDKNPVFRKIIVAWYDSEMACISMILIMLSLILFGIAGVSVALSEPAYTGFVWVPATLIGLCMILLFTAAVRLMRLYSD